MMRRARLVCCLCALALVFFLLPISPARAGDNATITNDRVNLRAEPATSGKILATGRLDRKEHDRRFDSGRTDHAAIALRTSPVGTEDFDWAEWVIAE